MKRKLEKNQFIDDEAELSEGEQVSDDELELSDDDELDDPDLIDRDAKELDSDQEEEIRKLYHKQLENEDNRAVLLLQEQLEDNDIALGAQRRRKFRWQTKELMDESLRRHYDPDDDDSQALNSDDDEDDNVDYSELKPRLRRPTAESLLFGSTRVVNSSRGGAGEPSKQSASGAREPVAATTLLSDDSNSVGPFNRPTNSTRSNGPVDLNNFVFRDKEIVAALSTKEVAITTREEKDRVIQREIKRVLTSKSIFDQLYS